MVRVVLPIASSCKVEGLQNTEGVTLSSTVTVAEQVALLPAASVTVKMTVFEPKLLQLKAVLDKDRTEMPQLSVELLSI